MNFFDGWHIARTLTFGTIAYLSLVLMLRVSGKRTLSKLNAFDLVVTVALGSSLATVLLSKDVPLAAGLAAFALLIGLQAAITWLSVRSPWVASLVKSEPRLVFFDGQPLPGALKQERVTLDELHAAVRQSGNGRIEDVVAVVMETDGSLSIVTRPAHGACTALERVNGTQGIVGASGGAAGNQA